MKGENCEQTGLTSSPAGQDGSVTGLAGGYLDLVRPQGGAAYRAGEKADVVAGLADEINVRHCAQRG